MVATARHTVTNAPLKLHNVTTNPFDLSKKDLVQVSTLCPKHMQRRCFFYKKKSEKHYYSMFLILHAFEILKAFIEFLKFKRVD